MAVQADKPSYGNWVPANMMKVAWGATFVLAVVTIALTFTSLAALACIAGVITLVLLVFSIYMQSCRRAFSQPAAGGLPEGFIRMEGLDGVMGQIHHFLLQHLEWDGRGTVLDIGCGSGALTIRTAKTFPDAQLVGIDFWGAEWSYAQEQCERNAQLEGVAKRITFQHGDAAKLDFADETFDAVVSNFVFHEVKSQPDKPELIKEALRVLRKGGSFALQDMFCQEKLYGDIDAVLDELHAAGIQEVNFVANVEDLGFVPKFAQAPWMITGVGLIYGVK